MTGSSRARQVDMQVTEGAREVAEAAGLGRLWFISDLRLIM